jgi:TetR/AcrR family transcriptional regulator, acrAB operon repressor
MRRTKEEAAETRRTLLSAALRVFSRKGYAATTLNDVADEAQVTRGAIYWHFTSKARLYESLVEEYYARAYAGLPEVLAADGSPLERLRRMILWMIDLAEDDADYRAVMELTIFKTETAPELEEGMARKREGTREILLNCAEMIRAAQAADELRGDLDAEAAALSLMALSNGLLTMWLLNPQLFPLKVRARAAVDLLLNGMRR